MFLSRRAASTKTRIETYKRFNETYQVSEVAGRHPLKQGLKPFKIEPIIRGGGVAGRHPLKQGLKLDLYTIRRFQACHVAGRHPLKQGLKLS